MDVDKKADTHQPVISKSFSVTKQQIKLVSVYIKFHRNFCVFIEVHGLIMHPFSIPLLFERVTCDISWRRAELHAFK